MRVCLANGKTPFLPVEANLPVIKYPRIMVGTKLTIIVNSDANGFWPCDVAIRGDDRNYGVLSARDFNKSTRHYDGSIFKAAIGKGGYVSLWIDVLTETEGFSYTGDPCAVSGDWFIIDYKAINIGKCNVGLYEWFSIDPIYDVCFSHVRSRDLNKDTEVNFTDFVEFASYWQVADCNDPNWCEGSDLDLDGDVDISDLMLFAEYWLETTEYNFCPRDFDYDTKVDFVDFAILASYWQVTDCCNLDWCEGSDLDIDGDVDVNDLMLFCDYWLKKTR